MSTKTKTSTKNNELIDDFKVFYGWGNQIEKTWFITNKQKTLLPKGSILLFEIGGVYTNEKISRIDNYPQKNDIISDVKGNNILVKYVKWV